MGAAEKPLGSRAERTRVALLDAAERIFAERGFASTRVEDVAAAVGIRRASIVYYFKDKRELYDAVLASVFGGLYERLASALSGHGSVSERIEAGALAWVDYVGERPTLARLLLREVADATPERVSGVLQHTQPFFQVIEKEILSSPELDDEIPNPVDSVHIAATIAGATVFFVAAIPNLVPQLGVDPIAPEQLAAHRDEVRRILRRLLGTAGRDPAEPDRGAGA
jgi:TetR/AcrR family transcriptional regulator